VTLETTKDGFLGIILQNVSIKAGELTTLAHGDIILELLGAEYAGLAVIHGFLFGETVAPGNQLENVAVTVSNGNDQTVFSQSNGSFYFIYDFGDSLVDQRVFVIFNKANYNENYRRMTISPGSAYDLGDIVMEPTASSTDNTAFIEGTVYRNAISPDSTLENVTVTFQGAEETPVFTTTDGTFSFEYPLSEGVITKEISVTFERLGFERHVETGVQLTANETTQVGNIVLNSTTDTVSAAGEPYAIQIGDIESYHIYVSESGLPEVTSIQVVVSDVRGQIIDDLHRVMVHFEIVGHPGMPGTNEAPTIYPDSAETVNGVATAYIQAGTKAGAVQIRAYFTREDGYSAQVYPIQIAIWGGLPVKENFGLAAATYNIAGMLWYLTDDITAYMGDRYHNPVAPGTVVYFTSDYSYIEGSANSDNLGMATATLVSGENRPYPYMDPDSAIVRIFTHTYNQYYEQVRDTTRLIYSSIATVSADHYSFTYNESDPSEA
ncbi:MAG: carboxypeptidase regulatory-like domain-containing protein, partial [Calditrichia bacterium]|nr:carboxypeptidase regulatory-like domain-containing protein [Calditrichia bacterium]